MMFNVPQYIDVEDKIVGSLTWKQLGWMVSMGVTLLVLFNVLTTAAFIVAAIPIVLAFAAFAFYKPNGFPLTTFIFYGFLFFFRPKVAVWERPAHSTKDPVLPETTAKRPAGPESKRMTAEALKNLARTLDNGRD